MEPLGSEGTLALGGSRAVVGNYRQTSSDSIEAVQVPESAEGVPHRPKWFFMDRNHSRYLA